MDERFIGIRLRSLNNAIRRYLDRYTHNIHHDTISCSNAWIIGHLAHSKEDVYQRDIEEHFGITRSTASKVLILLEKKGMIRREGVSHDARLKRLVLTRQGEEVAERIDSNGKAMESRLTDGFTDEEINLLISFISRMEANLDSSADAAQREEQL